MYYQHSIDIRRTEVPFYICHQTMFMIPPHPSHLNRVESDGKYKATMYTQDKGYSLEIARELFKSLGYNFLPTSQKDLKKT